MRFLFNTAYYKPAISTGGPVASVSALAEQLVARGNDVTVICSDLDLHAHMPVDTERLHLISGVQVKYFHARPTLLQRTGIAAFTRAGVFTFGASLNRWLDQHSSEFDVIDSQISFTNSNTVCSRFAKANRQIYFYHQRGNLDPIRLGSGRLKKLFYLKLVEKRVMARADVLIALTNAEVGFYRALGMRNRIEVVPNGIHPDRCERPSDTLSQDAAELISWCGDEPVFLWMSRIHPLKGLGIFVEAFINVAKRCPFVRGIIAGPDEKKELAEWWDKIVVAGLANRVKYAGILAGHDKRAVLQRADCYVLPTASEGFSMAILEAMAAGSAILTTREAYFNAIEGARAGIIAPRNTDAFAAAMLELARGGRNAMREMGVRGKILVESQYTWEAIAESYERIAKECIRRRE